MKTKARFGNCHFEFLFTGQKLKKRRTGVAARHNVRQGDTFSMKKNIMFMALTFCAAIALAEPPQQSGQPGQSGQRPPPPPIINALDANHDGKIDAQEIANASAALKTLDKNGDGVLTQEETRPMRPEGRPGERGGENRGPREGGEGRPPQSNNP